MLKATVAAVTQNEFFLLTKQELSPVGRLKSCTTMKLQQYDFVEGNYCAGQDQF